MPTLPPRRTHSAAALDANALELLARIVAAGSFAQAARELGLTRAAISRRVAGLETQLGTPLFARTTRALGLTEAGRRLAARARAVLEAAESARRSFRRGAAAGGGLAGSLRITSFAAFGESVLAPLVAAFQARHPALKLELRLTNRPVDLLRDDIDVAFRLTARPPPDCIAQPVLPMRVRAYAAPRKGLPLARPELLAGEPCLVFGAPAEQVTMSWQPEEPAGGEAQARPAAHRGSSRATQPDRPAPGLPPVVVTLEPALTADDLATLIAVARAGRGIVFAPSFMVEPWLANRSLAEVLPGWRMQLGGGEAVQALTLPQPEAPEAAREFVRFVRTTLAGAAEPVSSARGR